MIRYIVIGYEWFIYRIENKELYATNKTFLQNKMYKREILNDSLYKRNFMSYTGIREILYIFQYYLQEKYRTDA
jgi:hypothetical protein